jgi:hypothetical protein
LLELLLLLLFEPELALFFDVELEPDLVGIVLSFRPAQPLNGNSVPVFAGRRSLHLRCSPLVLIEQIGYVNVIEAGLGRR